MNIELKLCLADDEHRGPDSIEWYGMYGPACEGTADDMIAYEKKLRWFQLLKNFNCSVTSTWTNNEDCREFHTRRAWGSRGRKKQLDFYHGPNELALGDLVSKQVKIRTWDHFLVITRVEGQEIPTKKRVKGWAGWTPVSEGEVAKFQELVLHPQGALDEVALREDVDGEGVVHLHDRLVTAAAET